MNTPSSKPIVRRAGALVFLTLLLCAQAQAQVVRKCRVDGRLVVQSAPCAIEPQATAAPSALVADASEAPKQRTLADAIREREADNRTRTTAREKQIDGATILRARMGAL